MWKCISLYLYSVVFVLNDINTLRLFVLFIQTFCPILALSLRLFVLYQHYPTLSK